MKTKLNTTAQGQQAVSQDEQMTYVCKQCRQELPLEAFYVNRQTQCPDVYCKECRRKISRRRYENKDWTCEKQSGDSFYPIITQIEDKEERMRLIMNALSVVRQSVERKKAALREEEGKRRENHQFCSSN